jgi:hypothetical protein
MVGSYKRRKPYIQALNSQIYKVFSLLSTLSQLLHLAVCRWLRQQLHKQFLSYIVLPSWPGQLQGYMAPVGVKVQLHHEKMFVNSENENKFRS